MYSGFWKELEKPIVGLAPMDGVTDAAFRYMVCKYSRPDVVFTEFTNVEGLARGAAKMMVAFKYDESERPVVAQLYGVEVDSYYKCAVMLCAMGFDGIDINMGCPANKVARKGSGAGLIQTPALAKEIVLACKKGVKDWAEGMTMEEAGVHENCIAEVRGEGIGCAGFVRTTSVQNAVRRMIPVSIKTRTGFMEDVAEEWTKHLIDVEPANITMHGRTLRQMYLGKADWEVLGRTAALCLDAGVSFLGNGDVDSMGDAREKVEKYGMDGVLVGRAVQGNPWFFGGKMPDVAGRLKIALEHARYYEKNMSTPFHVIRKHLAWYCKGFDGAKELRMELMKVDCADDVECLLNNFSYSP